MAHLTDMEELLAEIESADIQDYMREAMTCYMSSAYRGCIVLSHIALFDGLLARLEELGKVHSDAKTIYKNAQEKKDDQDVFETYLIDQLYSKKLIAKLDADFLNILRNLRNKSAHPSGHKPSAEEARYIFFEVINRFLGQPLLETTGLVNKIIEELNNKNYFPTKKLADIEEAVKEAIAILAPEAYPQLIEKLLGKYTFKDKTIAQNANFSLNGLARLENEALTEELLTRVITAKLSDTNYSRLILCLVTSSDGKLFKNLSAIETNRFKKILQEKIASLDSLQSEMELSHPISVLRSLKNILTPEEFQEGVADDLLALAKQTPYSSSLIDIISSFEESKTSYMNHLKQQAGSYTFVVANEFAATIPRLDEDLDKLTTTQNAFDILLEVIDAASNNAHSSQALVSSKFNQVPCLKNKAINYLNENAEEAEKSIQKILNQATDIEQFKVTYLEKQTPQEQ